MIFWGKITGFVIGAFSGLGIYGIIVAVVLGHLVDMYLQQRKMKSAAGNFFSDPAGYSLPERELLIVSASGFSAHVSDLKTDKTDYALELISGILKTHLSLNGKETESVRDYAASYLDTPDPDISAVVEVYTASEHTPPADIALISALLRVEEQTGITQEKTRFIRNLSRRLGISDESFYSYRRQFLGVALENYEILGLPMDAADDEIKRTYRNLAAFFHPDGASMLTEEQKQESEEAFKAIKGAYEAIMKERTGS